ncbi:MAG: 4a-hydroxytetrahydrobiopterin dehydratase [Planctomycetes bacterium]|nr:4a-hydroxytetrahydrobiopterin dehydratase [Planctomycetota bacterium]
MTAPPLLKRDAIDRALADLPGWTLSDGKLRREYRFASFVDAFGWMASAALVAEAAQHHPEWRNCYGLVSIELTTHDSGGITQKDLDLARRMELLFLRHVSAASLPDSR